MKPPEGMTLTFATIDEVTEPAVDRVTVVVELARRPVAHGLRDRLKG